jgi:hypothetical protein
MVLPLLCECASVRGSDNQPRTQNDPYQRKGAADQSNPRDRRRNGQSIDLDRAACVGFWWTLQHGFLPFVPAWHITAWRCVMVAPGLVAMMLVYLRTRRLPLLIVAQWPMDIVAAAMSTLH